MPESVTITPIAEVSAVPKIPIVIEEKTTPSVQYQLITGSFKLAENAQKQVKQLISNGFTPEVIQASNGFFRVSAVGYSDIETAKLKRESILSLFPETWILKAN